MEITRWNSISLLEEISMRRGGEEDEEGWEKPLDLEKG